MEARTQICFVCNGFGGRQLDDGWRPCARCEGRGQALAQEPGLESHELPQGGREWVRKADVDRALDGLKAAVVELSERLERITEEREEEHLFAFRRAKSAGEGLQ